VCASVCVCVCVCVCDFSLRSTQSNRATEYCLGMQGYARCVRTLHGAVYLDTPMLLTPGAPFIGCVYVCVRVCVCTWMCARTLYVWPAQLVCKYSCCEKGKGLVSTWLQRRLQRLLTRL
jgi:hypothetical protein